MMGWVAYPIIKKWYMGSPSIHESSFQPIPDPPQVIRDKQIYFGDVVSFVNIGEKESYVPIPLPELSGGDDSCPCVLKDSNYDNCPCPQDSFTNVYVGVEHGDTNIPKMPCFLWRIVPSPSCTSNNGDPVKSGDCVMLQNLCAVWNGSIGGQYLGYMSGGITGTAKLMPQSNTTLSSITWYAKEYDSLANQKTGHVQDGSILELSPLIESNNQLYYFQENATLQVNDTEPNCPQGLCYRYGMWYIKKYYDVIPTKKK